MIILKWLLILWEELQTWSRRIEGSIGSCHSFPAYTQAIKRSNVDDVAHEEELESDFLHGKMWKDEEPVRADRAVFVNFRPSRKEKEISANDFGKSFDSYMLVKRGKEQP